MAKRKRQTHSAKFKSNVAIDALKEANTLAEIAYRHGIHTKMVGQWKRQAVAGLPELFVDGRSRDGKAPSKNNDDERLVRELFEQVGRLKMENEWLKKKLGC